MTYGASSSARRMNVQGVLLVGHVGSVQVDLVLGVGAGGRVLVELHRALHSRDGGASAVLLQGASHAHEGAVGDEDPGACEWVTRENLCWVAGWLVERVYRVAVHRVAIVLGGSRTQG